MKPVLAPLLAVLGFTLAGCVNFGDRSDSPAMVYYVLNDASPAVAPTQPQPDAPTLLVLDTTAGSFYDTEQIIFSRRAGTHGQYQLAHWTERPGKRFADLMRARLDGMGRYRVTAAAGYVRGDMLLDTELVSFYHDAASEPGHMRLVLRAELVDLKQRAQLGRRVFEQDVPLTRYDATGAAEASDIAISRTLDALAEWLASIR